MAKNKLGNYIIYLHHSERSVCSYVILINTYTENFKGDTSKTMSEVRELSPPAFPLTLTTVNLFSIHKYNVRLWYLIRVNGYT